MVVEERSSVNKALYRIELYLIKIIPVLFAGITFLNTVLSYFYIDIPILSYLASVSLLTLVFMYLSSIVFNFCKWHRMFIHYTTVNWILNMYDYYIGINVGNRVLFIIYLIITGIFLFLGIYFKQRYCKHVQ